MQLKVPELCLVVLVGPSGSGKSTFARKHFKPTEVISSDFCRGLVSDDEKEAVRLAMERLDRFPSRCEAAHARVLRAKLGLVREEPGDLAVDELIMEFE